MYVTAGAPIGAPAQRAYKTVITAIAEGPALLYPAPQSLRASAAFFLCATQGKIRRM